MYKVEDLDKRICDIEEDASNAQTYREYIKESEKEFGIFPADLDIMSDEGLTEYIEFLDYLWEK